MKLKRVQLHLLLAMLHKLDILHLSLFYNNGRTSMAVILNGECIEIASKDDK